MINYFIPIVVLIIIIYGIYKKVDIFNTFIEGVKEGMKISINLFPTIFTLIIAISLLVDSNFITTLTKLLNPIFNKINFFLKIDNNLQYFSPFRTYFTIHISFFLKFIVHFLPSADGSPVFLRKRFALSALFSIISGKTAGKTGKISLECSVVLC